MSILEKTAEAYDGQSKINSSDKPKNETSSTYASFNKSSSYSEVNGTGNSSNYQSHASKVLENLPLDPKNLTFGNYLSEYKTPYAALVAASIGDIATTDYAMKANERLTDWQLVEANPIAKEMMETFGTTEGLIGLKAAGLGLIFALGYSLYKKGDDKTKSKFTRLQKGSYGLKPILYLGSALTGAVALHNLSELQKVGALDL